MSINPTMSNFDPHAALYSSDNFENLSCSAKVYDNVAVFEANFSRNSKEIENKSIDSSRRSKSFSHRRKREEEALNRDVSKLEMLMEQRKKLDAGENLSFEENKKERKSKKKTKTNVFILMEKLSCGPMSLLYNARKNHFRVNVYIRSFNGLKGVFSGIVVLFDPFMNLSMVEVEEIFTISPRGKVAGHQNKVNMHQLNQVLEEIKKNGLCTERKNFTMTNELHTVKKYCGKIEKFHGGNPQLYYRHFDKIFVKGNSIVLISKPS